MKRYAGVLATLGLALYGCATTNAPAVDPRDEKIRTLETSIVQLSSELTADRRGRFSSPFGVADVHLLSLTMEAERLIYTLQTNAAAADQRRRTDALSFDIDEVWSYNMWHYFAAEGQLAAEERARLDADTKLGEKVVGVETTTRDLGGRVATLERTPAPQSPPNGPTAPAQTPERSDAERFFRGEMTLEEYYRRRR